MSSSLGRAAALAAVLCALPATASAATGLSSPSSFRWVEDSMEGSENVMYGVAPAAAPGEVYAVGPAHERVELGPDSYWREHARVARFTAAGALLTETAVDEVDGKPVSGLSVAAAPDGATVYLSALTTTHPTRRALGVLRIDPGDGDILGSFNDPGTGPGHADWVSDIAVAPDGTVYTLDGGPEGATGISAFSPTGQHQATIAPSDIRFVKAIAIDPRDESVLALVSQVCGDEEGERVDRYSSAGGARTGSFMTGVGHGLDAIGIGTGGTIYLVDGHLVDVRDEDGAPYGTQAIPPTPSSSLEFWHDIAVAWDGSRIWGMDGRSSGYAYLGTLAAAPPSAPTGPALPGSCPEDKTTDEDTDESDEGDGSTDTTGGGGGGATGGGSGIIGNPPGPPLASAPARVLPTAAATRTLLAAGTSGAGSTLARLKPSTVAAKGYTRSIAADQAGVATEELLATTGGSSSARAAARRRVVVARGTTRFAAAGTQRIAVRPTKAGKRALRRARRVPVVIRTTFRPASGAAPIVTTTRTTLGSRRR